MKTAFLTNMTSVQKDQLDGFQRKKTTSNRTDVLMKTATMTGSWIKLTTALPWPIQHKPIWTMTAWAMLVISTKMEMEFPYLTTIAPMTFNHGSPLVGTTTTVTDAWMRTWTTMTTTIPFLTSTTHAHLARKIGERMPPPSTTMGMDVTMTSKTKTTMKMASKTLLIGAHAA